MIGKDSRAFDFIDFGSQVRVLFVSAVICRSHQLATAMPFNDEQRRVFDTAYEKATTVGDNAKLVQLGDLMIKLLVDAGEAQLKYVHCKSIVPHRLNRSGANMQVRKIYTKGSKIMAVGFSLVKCGPERAVAFQVEPSDSRSVNKFNGYASRDKSFAKFESHLVEAASVGCGHLNQFLACIVDECVVPSGFESDTNIVCAQHKGVNAGETARMDRHDLLKRDGGQLADVLERGLKWTVIGSRIEQQYPKLPDVLQRSLNVEHHIGEGETWDEQFRAIALSIVEHYKTAPKAKAPDPKILARGALATQPPRMLDVPAQVEFCLKWGGGKEQPFSIDACKFIKLKKGVNHIVGASTFESLNKLVLQVGDMCPHFVVAILKCSATRGKARSGVGLHINDGDIKSIMSKRLSTVKEAEQFMAQGVEIARKVVDDDLDEARGDMECDMVEFIFEKTSKEERDATTLKSIVDAFVERIGGKTETKGTSNTTTSKATASADATGDGGGYLFDTTSDVAQQSLRNIGFNVGTIVANKTPSEPTKPKADVQFEIAYINDDGSVGLRSVTKRGVTAESVVVVGVADLTQAYKVVDEKHRLSIVDEYPNNGTGLDVGLYESLSVIGINVAFKRRNKVPSNAVYLQGTPSQKLIVSAEKIEVGGLAFVAWAPGVKAVKETTAHADNDVHAKLKFENDSGIYQFELHKPCPKTIVEFWKVKRVSNKEHANMEMTVVQENITVTGLRIGKVPAEVPCAVLFKDVHKGDELVLYVPAAPKTGTKRFNAQFQPVAKTKATRVS